MWSVKMFGRGNGWLVKLLLKLALCVVGE